VAAYQQCRRREDDIAIVTSCLSVSFREGSSEVSDSALVFGGMAVTAVSARNTQDFLQGKEWTMETIHEALKVMAGELALDRNCPGNSLYIQDLMSS
jgi:xanthine dehydrogenase iron-sulfur cluster and FAD-binding subunit A